MGIATPSGSGWRPAAKRILVQFKTQISEFYRTAEDANGTYL